MSRRSWFAGVVVVAGLLAISSATRVGGGGSPDGPTVAPPAPPSPPAKVDINTASAGELERLPGMTSHLSQRIIAHRPYRKIDDLVQRRVLGRKQLAAIKEHITVGAAAVRPARPPDR